MYKYISLLILSTCSPAFSQESNCAYAPELIETMYEQHGVQEHTWATLGSGEQLLTMVNPVNKKWALITVNNQELACLIAVGVGFTTLPIGTPA